MNCLEFALNEWDNDSSITILYNGDHVICEKRGFMFDKTGPVPELEKYLPLQEYGFHHILHSFKLAPYTERLLRRYFNVPSDDFTRKFVGFSTGLYSNFHGINELTNWATAYYGLSKEELYKFLRTDAPDDNKVLEFTKTLT